MAGWGDTGEIGDMRDMGGAGELWEALDAARAIVAVGDADLAATDQVFAGHLSQAHRLAVDCISRIEAVRSGIESGVLAVNRNPGAATALEMARFLLAANREVAAIVAEARAAAAAEAVAVRRLADYYQC